MSDMYFDELLEDGIDQEEKNCCVASTKSNKQKSRAKQLQADLDDCDGYMSSHDNYYEEIIRELAWTKGEV